MQANEEKWQQLVTEHAVSGKRAASFCRECGINDNRLAYWRKRLSEPERGEPAGKFVSVGSGNLVEIELESGIQVRCGVESLKAVVDVLCS